MDWCRRSASPGGYVFSVLLQGVNPGAFVNGLTVLTHLGELVLSEVKALLFGVVAGLVGCYRGLTVKGGPKGVGNAVNEPSSTPSSACS
jgi:phospholipid/cholesterol/gamma-HCH transport system permease protein